MTTAPSRGQAHLQEGTSQTARVPGNVAGPVGSDSSTRMAGTPAHARQERGLPRGEGRAVPGSCRWGTIWTQAWHRCATRIENRELGRPSSRQERRGARCLEQFPDCRAGGMWVSSLLE